MLCYYLPYSKVNQPCITYIYPLFLGFPSYVGHHRALGRVPYAVQQVLSSYLFYTQYQQCIYVNLNLPIHPTPFERDECVNSGFRLPELKFPFTISQRCALGQVTLPLCASGSLFANGDNSRTLLMRFLWGLDELVLGVLPGTLQALSKMLVLLMLRGCSETPFKEWGINYPLRVQLWAEFERYSLAPRLLKSE